MGIFTLQMRAPLIFTAVTFGMGIFAIICCVMIAKNKDKEKARTPVSGKYDPGFIAYTGNNIAGEDLSQKQKIVYTVPSQCPSCKASISIEEVDWVGPMKTKCPFCMEIIDAEEHNL